MLHEFTIKIPYGQADEITEKLNVVGIYNVYYEAPIEVVVIPNGYDFEEQSEEKIDFKIYASDVEVENLPASYFQLIEESLHMKQKDVSYQFLTKVESDFSLEDIDLGNGWVISYPDYKTYENKCVLKFDPQAAFGTGLHETTQDCLRIILEKDFVSQSVLDLGSGSGILTTAAALKNARKLKAVDFEPVRRELVHNFKLNDLHNELTIEQADLLAGEYKVKDIYDWTFINIGADEALEIIQRHSLLDKSKHFILSGLVEWNIEGVLETFLSAGFTIQQRLQSAEWVTLHFDKKG
ncbi:ribosomal protein L11 methyltransferase [Salirhabdus euzebyi]|uniref:Ribosomal protein L11 methyltransferase n=1 Tax=Salirhabdus euzebyi TaxID=394506 RepID=A0A841Q4R3_9BACI|nr:50S ribosomal protein L11 methyltransferase [Salirhabdus euzebyi]MBB6453340.1 ribosomal protein L11 methyltransferase [Salirhabdus euzebyi]